MKKRFLAAGAIVGLLFLVVSLPLTRELALVTFIRATAGSGTTPIRQPQRALGVWYLWEVNKGWITQHGRTRETRLLTVYTFKSESAAQRWLASPQEKPRREFGAEIR